MSSEDNVKEKYDISNELVNFIKHKNPAFLAELVNGKFEGSVDEELTAYKALYVIEKGLISPNELVNIVNEVIAK